MMSQITHNFMDLWQTWDSNLLLMEYYFCTLFSSRPGRIFELLLNTWYFLFPTAYDAIGIGCTSC